MGIAETCRENLIAIADAYGKAMGVPQTSVSKKFYGNRTFLEKYRAGECSVIVSKLDEMVDAFREAWPPGTPWPGRGPFGRRG